MENTENNKNHSKNNFSSFKWLIILFITLSAGAYLLLPPKPADIVEDTFEDYNPKILTDFYNKTNDKLEAKQLAEIYTKELLQQTTQLLQQSQKSNFTINNSEKIYNLYQLSHSTQIFDSNFNYAKFIAPALIDFYSTQNKYQTCEKNLGNKFSSIDSEQIIKRSIYLTNELSDAPGLYSGSSYSYLFGTAYPTNNYLCVLDFKYANPSDIRPGVGSYYLIHDNTLQIKTTQGFVRTVDKFTVIPSDKIDDIKTFALTKKELTTKCDDIINFVNYLSNKQLTYSDNPIQHISENDFKNKSLEELIDTAIKLNDNDTLFKLRNQNTNNNFDKMYSTIILSKLSKLISDDIENNYKSDNILELKEIATLTTFNETNSALLQDIEHLKGSLNIYISYKLKSQSSNSFQKELEYWGNNVTKLINGTKRFHNI